MTTKTKLKYFTGTISLLLVLGVWLSGCFDSTQTKVQRRLARLRLAPLPNSATNLRFHEWSGLGTGETYIRIQMESNDLVQFLNNSPCLIEGKLKIVTPEQQHLPQPKHISEYATGHLYFSPSRLFPQWFDLTITNRGKVYEFWPTDRLIINEDTSTVYIHLIKG